MKNQPLNPKAQQISLYQLLWYPPVERSQEFHQVGQEQANQHTKLNLGETMPPAGCYAAYPSGSKYEIMWTIQVQGVTEAMKQ